MTKFFQTKIPIKTLIHIVSKRTLFHIYVEKYERNLEFKANGDTLKLIEKQFNVTINLNKPNDPLNMYAYSNKYTDALLTWNNCYKDSVLDIVCIAKSFEIRCATPTYISNGLHVEDLNRKKDDISLICVT